MGRGELAFVKMAGMLGPARASPSLALLLVPAPCFGFSSNVVGVRWSVPKLVLSPLSGPDFTASPCEEVDRARAREARSEWCVGPSMPSCWVRPSVDRADRVRAAIPRWIIENRSCATREAALAHLALQELVDDAWRHAACCQQRDQRLRDTPRFGARCSTTAWLTFDRASSSSVPPRHQRPTESTPRRTVSFGHRRPRLTGRQQSMTTPSRTAIEPTLPDTAPGSWCR
jgi:hypothetical protein